jgi:hypothetical protein
MAAFGLWVVGTAVWHAWHGTLPSAFTMGAVGVAASVANAASFGLLWTYRRCDANIRSARGDDTAAKTCDWQASVGEAFVLQ